jgi:hypothetical protein
MDVNPVQQRARNTLLVLGDRRVGASAGFLAVSVITARAGLLAIPLKACGTLAQFFIPDEG